MTTSVYLVTFSVSDGATGTRHVQSLHVVAYDPDDAIGQTRSFCAVYGTLRATLRSALRIRSCQLVQVLA